jgi:hypothetical protein
VIGGVEIKSGKKAVGEERYVEGCEGGEVGVHTEGRDGRHQRISGGRELGKDGGRDGEGREGGRTEGGREGGREIGMEGF